MFKGFARQLMLYGPKSRRPAPTRSQARAYCSDLARTHYENFSVASLLLPRRLLRPFHTVYAYCRWADDLADEVGGGQLSLDLLQWWREELLRCYGGQPRHPVMVALRETIERYRIPPDPFLNLLLAFEQDQRVKRYATFEQLLGYCQFSANPVGHLVLYLCESFDTRRAGLSDHICTALQLANFWQDVARDWEIGRVYLPEESRKQFGYTDADLQARRFNPAFRALMEFEVRRTRAMFLQGEPLIALMPLEVQPDIELFLRGGQAILAMVEQQGFDVWKSRPALSKQRKLALMGRVLWKKLAAALPLLRPHGAT